jgi:hypothetical protein
MMTGDIERPGLLDRRQKVAEGNVLGLVKLLHRRKSGIGALAAGA